MGLQSWNTEGRMRRGEGDKALGVAGAVFHRASEDVQVKESVGMRGI